MSKNLLANHEFMINLIIGDYEPRHRNFKISIFWYAILSVWELNYPLILQNPIVQILFVRYRLDLIEKYFSQEMRSQRNLVKAILKYHRHRYDLKFFDDQYRSDKEIAIFAICCHEKNFDDISASLKNDPEVLSTFLRHCDDIKRVKYCLSSISQKTINDRSILKLIAKKWPNEVLVHTKNVDDYLLQKIIQHKQKSSRS
jgi:hypothetical protein